MSVSKQFVEETAVALSAARPVTFKKMFGGTGYYCEDAFFAVGDDDHLFFKVDDLTRGSFLEHGMEVWICGGQEMHAYREVPSHVLTDPVLCGTWIDAAVGAARRLKSKKK